MNPDKPPAKPNISSYQYIGGAEAMEKVKRENRKDTIIFLCIMIPFTLFLAVVAYFRISYPESDLPCSAFSERAIADLPARCASYFGVK